MRYYITTFGCQMNKSDSERIVASLKKKGYKPASEMKKADLVVVNMCSVRQPAVNRIFGLMPKFKKIKARKILTGCVLKKDKAKFREIFDSVIPRLSSSYHTTPKHQSNFRAYIPVSNGCDNFCTYCVVPYTRGPLVCRDHKEILREVKNAVKNGVKEIWLLGQNVNKYEFKNQKAHCSHTAKIKINFAKLLKMANALPGDFKIRFTSPNPADFSGELVDAMAKCEKVAKFLNLPVQSGDNQILRKMGRPYTVEQYKNLVKKIREKIPDINLSTDVIVGFPGETKMQFENTLKLFKKIKFNLAYISKYSPRPGTAAFRLKDDVSIKEKKRREKILMELLI